ncbi:MAG: hypothetical protein HY059_15435 [Proteobacteria bacterium]|nr:hypothetical protein [Pseudomonadota bacterium]
MSDSITPPPIASPRFEMRPNPLRPGDTEAAPVYVDLDAKPLSFSDALQAINPLQQLPVIGSIYRAVTGATIEPAARVVGGILFGGLGGGLSAVANAIVESLSGKDIGDRMIAMVAPDKNAPPAPPALPATGSPLAPEAAGGFQLASFGATSAAAGPVERNGLLATWIAAGAPRAPEAPAPVLPRTEIRSAELQPPAAPTQTATAVAQLEMPARPSDATSTPIASLETRAMPLDAYRARALANPGLTARSPAINDSLGLAQRGEATRALAAYRAPPGASPLPAALQAQQTYENAGDSAQAFFGASVARGLDRYRQLQQQRDEASKRGI